jgi:tRNA(Ile)-lysidine synthase
MTSLARRVARAIRENSLLTAGDRAAVAVSGGADSVALVWLLHELAVAAAWQLAGLVHVHHGLRGADADEDEAFCRALAARLGVPIDVTRVDVEARARATRRSVEVAARDLRYAAFREAMTRLDATVVATGHTLDDQAETVLLRLLRGAGTRGLAGIRPRRGPYVRPLLGCRRAELRDYLSARGETFRDDLSNADVAIARNRLRHELMPVIERIAPGGVRALARCAALAADDEAFLRRAVAQQAAGVLRLTPGGSTGTPGRVDLDAAALARLPPALARRFVRDLAEQVSGHVWSAGHVDDLLALARADTDHGHLDVPGSSASRRAGTVVLRRTGSPDDEAATRPADVVERPLAVPGEVHVPELRLTLRATPAATAEEPISSEEGRVMVQADALRHPLTVRTRRPGDRLRPLGAPGSRKLQDVFVDRKVPRDERDRIPLVVDAQGRIVWVAGLVLSHDCRVTEPRKGMVILELRR